MITTGAKIRWKDGNILHPSHFWKSPSKRRLPRLLIENRAQEIGLLVYIEEPWIVFHETDQAVDQIGMADAVELERYAGRYRLLPEKIKRQDSYNWLAKPSNAFLLWGKEGHYFVKVAHRLKMQQK